MRNHKTKFEDYEEIALCLRTAKQLLYVLTMNAKNPTYDMLEQENK